MQLNKFLEEAGVSTDKSEHTLRRASEYARTVPTERALHEQKAPLVASGNLVISEDDVIPQTRKKRRWFGLRK